MSRSKTGSPKLGSIPKVFLKILLFLLSIFQANISVAKSFVFDVAVSEIKFTVDDVERKNDSKLIPENDFGISCKSKSDLVDYRNLVMVVKATAAKTGVQATEGIYQFTAASGKTYIGQSGNIAARLEQHIASGKLLPGTSVRTTEVLGGKTAREIAEQLRINSLGGIKYLENIRNPIGPARQYLLPKIP